MWIYPGREAAAWEMGRESAKNEQVVSIAVSIAATPEYFFFSQRSPACRSLGLWGADETHYWWFTPSRFPPRVQYLLSQLEGDGKRRLRLMGYRRYTAGCESEGRDVRVEFSS